MNAPAPKSPRRPLPIAAIVIGLVFLSLMGLLLYGVSQSGRADRDALPSPLIGKPAPAFALPVLHEPQRTVTLEQLKGQPFLLNVWGSWCPGCREEHAVVNAFAKTGRVRVLATSGKKRSPYLPDVPTFTELGFPDVTSEEWFGFYAPAKIAPATQKVACTMSGAVQLGSTSLNIRRRWPAPFMRAAVT